MTTWSRQVLAGWGRFPTVEAACARPERRDEVVAALADRQGEPILAHGMGRSYGDAALLREGRVVLTRRLNRMLSFEEETGLLTCEAGVSLEEIINTFLPRGYFPPVVPGTQFVTVGGAIGCNIHGKNHHVDGCFGDHVRSMDLLLGSGDVVTVTRESHPELFWATVGGMGLTGLILSATIQLTPVVSPAIELETIRVESLDHFFEVSADSAGFTHTMSWVDIVTSGRAMGRGVFMRGGHAREGLSYDEGAVDRLAQAIGKLASGKSFNSNLLLNKLTIKAFNEAYFRKEKRGMVSSVTHYKPFFFPLDAVADWNYIYGPRGFLQYQLVVPEREAVRAILKDVSSSGQLSFLSVIKEFGEHTHGGLSFPERGITLAMDFPNTGAPLMALFERLDAMVLEAGGRVYLGKDARLPAEAMRRMYPEWARWKAVRDAHDPEGVFSSALGRRLGLV